MLLLIALLAFSLIGYVQMAYAARQTSEVRYVVDVFTGNKTVNYVSLNVTLISYFNGTVLQGCNGNLREYSGAGIVNITFSRIDAESDAACQFTVAPSSEVPSAGNTLSEFEGSSFRNRIDLQDFVRYYGLAKINVSVIVMQTIGFFRFPVASEVQYSTSTGWTHSDMRYDVSQDIQIMLLLSSATLLALFVSRALAYKDRFRRVAETAFRNAPYLTMTVFAITTVVWLFFGFVGENYMLGFSGQSLQTLIGVLSLTPVAVFLHFNTAHYECNMFCTLPWQGVPTGLLPIGFIVESILTVRRKIFVVTYFLSTYTSIVGVRVGLFFGYGASLGVYALAGLCCVALFHSLFSRETPKRTISKIALFSAALYLGYAATSLISGYLFPLAPNLLTRTTSFWLGTVADPLAHLLAFSIPLLLTLRHSWKEPEKLFRNSIAQGNSESVANVSSTPPKNKAKRSRQSVSLIFVHMKNAA